VNLNEDENEWVTFAIQTKALLWKNFLILKRKMRIMAFLTISPFIIGWFLTIVETIGHVVDVNFRVDGNLKTVENFVACTQKEDFIAGRDIPCLTLGYGIIGPHDEVEHPDYSRYHDVMQILGKNQGY
jgi:hypothetical protein